MKGVNTKYMLLECGVRTINTARVTGPKPSKIGQGQTQGHLKVIQPHQVWCHLKGFQNMFLCAKDEVSSNNALEVMPS